MKKVRTESLSENREKGKKLNLRQGSEINSPQERIPRINCFYANFEKMIGKELSWGELINIRP